MARVRAELQLGGMGWAVPQLNESLHLPLIHPSGPNHFPFPIQDVELLSLITSSRMYQHFASSSSISRFAAHFMIPEGMKSVFQENFLGEVGDGCYNEYFLSSPFNKE